MLTYDTNVTLQIKHYFSIVGFDNFLRLKQCFQPYSTEMGIGGGGHKWLPPLCCLLKDWLFSLLLKFSIYQLSQVFFLFFFFSFRKQVFGPQLKVICQNFEKTEFFCNLLFKMASLPYKSACALFLFITLVLYFFLGGQ